MSQVSPAVSQRTQRTFREYHRLIQQRSAANITKEVAQALVKNLVLRGKIKPDRANGIMDVIFKDHDMAFPANQIIRRDWVETKNLSSNFPPIMGVFAGLNPGTITSPDRKFLAMQVVVLSTMISKKKIEYLHCYTGIQLNFHAIARLDERDIDRDPVYGLADNLNTILIFSTLFQFICDRTIGLNFVIPYNKHLLFGAVASTSVEGYHKAFGSFEPKTSKPPMEIGNPGNVSTIEIKTAVSFDELAEEQDKLHDALVVFATENIDDINTLFESYYCSPFTNITKEQVEITTTRLKSKFRPIARLPAWIKLQQK